MDSDPNCHCLIVQVQVNPDDGARSPELIPLEELPNLTIPDSEAEGQGDSDDENETAELGQIENQSLTRSSDDYEDAYSSITLSPISSANLSDDPSFREITPDVLEPSPHEAGTVREEKLHFLLTDYMLDVIVYAEAFLGYQKLMNQVRRRICLLREELWKVSNAIEEGYYFGAHHFYEKKADEALKEMRAQQFQWLLLVTIISENQYEHLKPSDVYERLVDRFTQIQLDAECQLIRSWNPTKVFHQFILQPGLRSPFPPKAKACGSIVRWQPFDHLPYLEGFGVGLGETTAESKRISHDEACRDILKQICTKFSNFVESLRRGDISSHAGLDVQFCFVLFQHVCPNTLEYSSQNPTLRFNFRNMNILSLPISRDAMERTSEYLKQCGSHHIPLSKMNSGVEEWIQAVDR